MLTMLRTGQQLQTQHGMVCRIEAVLGSGGQGEVYRVKVGDNAMALKWYFPTSATSEQRKMLEELIQVGAPNNKFLWPQELVLGVNERQFGYLMPLRGEHYKNIVALMRRTIDPTFYALATAGLQLADSYLQLHTSGFCYRDISFGNMFFETKSGDVLICDNDNVTVNGTNVSSIAGTDHFKAPEIVRGEAVPSTQTDLFSLAVLLFHLFFFGHPLLGKREADISVLDEEAKKKLYGTHPVFIFDPNDTSNRPVKGYQDNPLTFWRIYPQFVRDIFVKAFTQGLHDPLHGRIRESEWRNAMVLLRDSIYYCSHCHAENFYDGVKVSGGKPTSCWKCGQETTLPFRMRISNHVVMLNHDTKLYLHHIDSHRQFDFSQYIAEMTRHPMHPDIWGLKNVSREKWIVTKTDGSLQEVEVGRSVSLAVGSKINFGNTQGEIRY